MGGVESTMKTGIFLLVLAGFCSLVLAVPPQRVAIEYNKPASAAEWSVVGRTPGTEKIELLFAVKQTNLNQLESVLVAASDPRSERYGQHLSNDAVHRMIAPDPARLTAVYDWLRANGIDGHPLSPNHDWISAEVSTAQAEMLLDAEYYQMHHHQSNTTIHRLLKPYTLPADVSEALDLVAPTVHIPPAPRPVARDTVEAPQIGNGPKHLRDLYDVDTEGLAPDNKMAVTAFIGQHYSKGDLHEFWSLFCGGIHCGKGDPLLKGDATTGILSGTESMLDIGNITSEFWGYAGHAEGTQNEPFLKWLSMLSNTSDEDIPKVFSTSYGEDEDSWSLAAATRMNTEFQKAGVRGISLLFASGDEGANCEGEKFAPETPGSSPWVTAVGGTGGQKAKEFGLPLSSGGFSNRWAQPTWQADAVKKC